MKRFDRRTNRKLRRATVAGSWYAGTANGLKAQIDRCFTHELGPGKPSRVLEQGPRNLIGLMCPHAGYMYSGHVAAHSYYHLALDGKPDVVVLLGPNHTGRGSALALMNEGIWRTPLGDVEIATQTANQILDESAFIDVDDTAHAYEHSIELQLPFLQYLYSSAIKFVPINFLIQDLESSREVGQAIARALSRKNALIIASTDMTHYESQKSAETKDKKALDAAIQMDEEEYYLTVESNAISTCGCGPTIALIVASKALGATTAQLLSYKTSGNITGDYSNVVGYASVSFSKN